MHADGRGRDGGCWRLTQRRLSAFIRGCLSPGIALWNAELLRARLHFVGVLQRPLYLVEKQEDPGDQEAGQIARNRAEPATDEDPEDQGEKGRDQRPSRPSRRLYR